jgi:hypothetical protein
MPIFLLIAALFIPLNLWAAITPHLHSDLSMRLLHGSSLLLLLPALVDLLRTLMGVGNRLRGLLSMVLAVFLLTLTVVNLQIVYSGMGVEMGWLAHIFLSLAMTAVITFYLLRPEESSGAKLGQ